MTPVPNVPPVVNPQVALVPISISEEVYAAYWDRLLDLQRHLRPPLYPCGGHHSYQALTH